MPHRRARSREKKFFSNLIAICIVAFIGFALFWSYQNLYLQTVDALSITGDRSRLTVNIQSDIPDERLSVICTDQYGNALTQSVADGQSTFTGLKPNTMYTITLEVDGYRKLTGETSQVFTTDTTTSILSFTSVAGPEDGSLILYFTVDGDEPEEWGVSYGSDGSEPEYRTFTGHSFSVEGLKVGKVYSFTLDAGAGLSLGGETTLKVMANRLILADDLHLISTGNGDLTVRWRTPGDIVVDSWKVRCYNDAGYDSEVTVHDTEAFFSNVDFGTNCNIEVTAAGMTQAARAGFSANPVNVLGLKVDESNPDRLDLHWDYSGDTPAGGWLLLYSIDGSEMPNVIKTDVSDVSISPRIPGAKYTFTIQAADGSTVLSNVQEYVAGEAQAFEEYNLSASGVTANLVKTPESTNWKFEDLGESAFTSTFPSGSQISVVLRGDEPFYLPGADTQILYVIRDADGNVQTNLLFQETVLWKQIWNGGDAKIGELNVPKAPTIPGKYKLNLYIDNMEMAELDFEISQ